MTAVEDYLPELCVWLSTKKLSFTGCICGVVNCEEDVGRCGGCRDCRLVCVRGRGGRLELGNLACQLAQHLTGGGLGKGVPFQYSLFTCRI
jgi:hypothetical protein